MSAFMFQGSSLPQTWRNRLAQYLSLVNAWDINLSILGSSEISCIPIPAHAALGWAAEAKRGKCERAEAFQRFPVCVCSAAVP
eukprot:7382463-Pyramimonas_sp.AAC.1